MRQKYIPQMRRSYITPEEKFKILLKEQLDYVLVASAAVLNDVLELPDEQIMEFADNFCVLAKSMERGIDDYSKTKGIVEDFLADIKAEKDRRHGMDFAGLPGMIARVDRLKAKGGKRTIINVDAQELEMISNCLHEAKRMKDRRKDGTNLDFGLRR